MQSYRDQFGIGPDFRVHYKFLSASEGGRLSPPFQHIRSDFLYADDDPVADGIWCIWPEFVSEAGTLIPADQRVPVEGLADMYILNAELRAMHAKRLQLGTKCFFVEGAKKTAECEVVAIWGLANAEL